MRSNLKMLVGIGALVACQLGMTFAYGQAISLNVGRRNNNLNTKLQPADVAGAYPAANWNDVTIGPGDGTTSPIAPPTTVVDSNGVVQPTTSITFAGIGLFQQNRSYGYGPTGNPANDANLHLMDSFFEASANPSPFGRVGFTVSNIPYATYDLYVYIDAFGPFNSNTAVSQWDLSTGATPISTIFAIDGSTVGFPATNFTFTEYHASTLAAAQAAVGTGAYNYFKVSGLTAANLTVSGINALAPTFVGNPGVNGIQIVNAVPEPTSLAMAGVALTFSLIARRRRS